MHKSESCANLQTVRNRMGATMIVMTTGLSGLMALMKQDAKSRVRPNTRIPVVGLRPGRPRPN